MSFKKSAPMLLMMALLVAAPNIANAHSGTGGGGFWAGMLHPVLGLDHMAAMVAVGLWGAFLGAPAIWLLPIIFPMVMAVGALIGFTGFELPLTEWVIAVSALVLGVMILFRAKLPLAFAASLIGVFAVFHGYAHGAELPESAHAYAYVIGFVVATGGLHVCGILLGALIRWPAGVVAVRSTGALIAGLGAYFAMQLA